MKQLDLVSEWLSTVSYNCSQSKATEEQYKRVWSRFTHFAENTAEEIVADYQRLIQENSGYDIFKRKYAQIIRAWINQLAKDGLTNTSVKVMVGAVKSFFKWNDLPLGKIPQAKSGEVFHNRDITKDEIVQIMALLKPREKAFCAVMAQSGLRPHTIKQLRLKNLDSLETIPCKIEVPKEIAKGKYGSYVTFIGQDALKYLKQYLATRTDLSPESLVFCAHDDPNSPVSVKDMSRAFRLSARALEKSGALKYEVRAGKPSELRLYVLRKFFKKFARQMGDEQVEYMMGHTIKGVSGNYRPQDPEFYRDLYAKQAMPHLRLETATPSETENEIEELRTQLATVTSKLAEKDAEIQELKQTQNSQIANLIAWQKKMVEIYGYPDLSEEERKEIEETEKDFHERAHERAKKPQE